MRKLKITTTNSLSTARSAQRQYAELQKSMRELHSSMAGLNRAVKAPVPKGGNRYIKGTRASPSILLKAGENSLGKFFASNLISSLGLGSTGSFYNSSSQLTSLWMDAAQQAQRIR